MDKKKKRIILACIIIVAVCFLRVVFWTFGDLDELWNYDMGKAIAIGYVPYRDFNRVQTPLYAFISAFGLIIFKNLLAYRITAAVVLSVLMLLIYKAISERADDYFALPVTILCIVFTRTVTYNTLFLIFALSIYILLSRKNTFKRDFLIGFLAACSAFTRQTSGGFLIVLVLIVLASTIGGEKEFRNRMKDVLLFLAGFAVPCFLMLVYLLTTESFFAFWQNCLFNLLQFGSDTSMFIVDSIPNLALSLIGIICDVMLIKQYKRDTIIHLTIGIPIVLISLPIVDGVHTYLSAVWFAIPIVVFVVKRLGKNMTAGNTIVLTSVFIAMTIGLTVFGLRDSRIINGFPELKGIFVDEDLVYGYNAIAMQNNVYKSQGKTVYSLTYSAVLIPLADNSGMPYFDGSIYDFVGNSDPEEYISDVCSNPDSVILMPDDYDTEGWQNPSGVYEYVVSNCEPVASYGRFKWYKPAETISN